MAVEENKDLVRRYFDTIWNNGQIEREAEFVAKDIVVHAAPFPGLPPGISGPIFIVTTFRAAMPDIHLTHDDLFGEDDMVVQRWHTTGHHTGEDLFGVPASGKELVITGINQFRVADERLAERWGVVDAVGLMQQLGVIPMQGG
jgi:steroid delta-isomerase-like uncharacterized protein